MNELLKSKTWRELHVNVTDLCEESIENILIAVLRAKNKKNLFIRTEYDFWTITESKFPDYNIQDKIKG